MRNAFADEITNLLSKYKDLILLSGDIGNKLFDKFKAQKPNNFVNCGIAEANMMGLAAGMAMSGLRPIVYTITPFLTTRCLEQIKIDVCYHKLPVIIVGTGSGLSYGHLGATHHSCEDIGIMRVFPEITIIAPADQEELRLSLNAAIKLSSPVYIRIGKKGETNISKKNSYFKIGKSTNISNGKDVCFIGTGTIMSEVILASKKLEKKGISCRVESLHTIKPLDKKMLDEVFNCFSLVCTFEEHYLIGGLSSAISEYYISQRKKNVSFLAFGIPDKFISKIGSQNYLRKEFGLSSDQITKKVIKALLK